jgi:hypothetical protein
VPSLVASYQHLLQQLLSFQAQVLPPDHCLHLFKIATAATLFRSCRNGQLPRRRRRRRMRDCRGRYFLLLMVRIVFRPRLRDFRLRVGGDRDGTVVVILPAALGDPFSVVDHWHEYALNSSYCSADRIPYTLLLLLLLLICCCCFVVVYCAVVLLGVLITRLQLRYCLAVGVVAAAICKTFTKH